MGWDQPTDQREDEKAPVAVDIEFKPASDNDNLHSLFIKDILELPATRPTAAPEAGPVVAPPRVALDEQITAQQMRAIPETYSAPRYSESPVTMPADMAGVQNLGPSQHYGGMPGQFDSRSYLARRGERGPTPFDAQIAGPLYQPPAWHNRAYNLPPLAAQVLQGALDSRPQQGNTVADRRRPFQPQFVQQGRPEMPQGAPQEQHRQRLFGRGLFQGDRQRRGEGEQPAVRNQPMQKHEFIGQNETGIVKEIQLPANFKEVPKDPAMPPGADLIQREFTVPGSRSHVTMYEGRELTADEQKSLKTALAKPGKLKPNTPAYDEACMVMGAGYHTFVNNPEVTVGKFNGRDALFITDEGLDENRKPLIAQTILVPSDRGQFLYAITYDGHKGDFPAVKKGLDSIKFRATPDSVAPPQPRPKK